MTIDPESGYLSPIPFTQFHPRNCILFIQIYRPDPDGSTVHALYMLYIDQKKGASKRSPINRTWPASYHMATGLMIICTVPLMRAWPSTNMNSFTPSFARRPVFIVSRMYMPFSWSMVT
jgi:hypothetical protein